MTQEIKDSRLIAFAILGYIFCFFGWQLPLILVVAYALAIAKDNLLSKQSLQALYLYIAYTVVLSVLGWVFSVLVWLATAARIYGLVSFLTGAQATISTVFSVFLFVLVLLMILKLARGVAPELPLLGRLADLTLGLAAPKTKQAAYTAPAAAQTQAPSAQTPVATSLPAQAPVATPPPLPTHPSAPAAQASYSPPSAPAAPPEEKRDAELEQEIKPEPVSEPAPQPQPASPPAPPPQPDNPPAPLLWTCACGRENKGKFCVSCGKPKA